MDPMLREALRKYNRLRQQLDNLLLGENGDEWETELKKFVARRTCWPQGSGMSLVEPKPTLPILELVSTVVIPATTGRFVAGEKFVRDTSDEARVKISYLGDNFTTWFLSGDGQIEDPIPETTLRYHKLQRSSLDNPIISELGGEDKVLTTLSVMFSLVEGQGRGGDGPLLINGRPNIFYIQDNAGVFRTVHVPWCPDGWYFDGFSVENLHEWCAGNQVFSPVPHCDSCGHLKRTHDESCPNCELAH